LLTALQKRSLRSAKGTQLRPLWPRSQGTSQSVFARGPSNPVPHPDLSPSSPVPHPDLSPIRTCHRSGPSIPPRTIHTSIETKTEPGEA